MHAPKWRRAMIASTASVSLLLATPGFAALAQTDSPLPADSTAVDSPAPASPTVADSSVGNESEDEDSATTMEDTTTVADAPATSGQSAPVAEPSEDEEESGPIVSIKREVFVRVDGSTVTAWWSPVEGVNHYTVKLVNTTDNSQVGGAEHTVHNTQYFYNISAGSYKVEVTAWTNDSQPNTPFYSKPLNVTNDRTKPSAPNAPSIELLGGNKARVDWFRNSNGGLPITHSTVTLTPSDSSANIVVKVDGDEETTVVSNLVAGKTYTASVTATNAAGTSDPSPASEAIVATEDPQDLQLTANPTLIDSTVNNEITVTGSGYTGGAAQQGLYIVVWDTQKWQPGARPSATSPANTLSFEVKPEEISNGSFTKKITIPANSLLLNQGVEYQVGTVAGGTAVATDRRVDKSVPLSLKAQPVTSVQATPSDKNKVTVTWGRPTDLRVKSYRIKLYDASVTPYKYVDQKDLGYQLGRAEFLNVKPGTYIVGIAADIATEWWDTNYSKEVFSRPFVVEKEKATLPSVPGSPRLQAGPVPGSLTVSWVDVNTGAADRASSYTIVFSNGTDTRIEHAGRDDSQLTFTGFAAGSWTATVTAHNSAGSSAPSVSTEAVTVAPAPVVRNLDLQVSQDLIDTKKDSTVTVTGSGYSDTTSVKLAIVPVDEETPKLLETDVQVANGQFTHQLRIPANTLDAKKKYTVLSYKGDDYKQRALLKLADPAVAKPQLIADNTVVSADRATTISVTGSGYVGDGAAHGTYVFVYDTSTWQPGRPLVNPNNATTKWIQPAQIRDGRFATVLNIPAGTLEKGKQYAIGTSAAHALSQTDRSLDFSLPLTVKFPETAPSSTPKPTQPAPTTSAPTTSAKPTTSAPKPTQPAPTTSAKPTTSAPTTSAKPSTSAPKPTQPAPKPEPKPEPKPGTNPWVIVASVLGVVAAIAAALGAVAALFPQAVNMLKARLGL